MCSKPSQLYKSLHVSSSSCLLKEVCLLTFSPNSIPVWLKIFTNESKITSKQHSYASIASSGRDSPVHQVFRKYLPLQMFPPFPSEAIGSSLQHCLSLTEFWSLLCPCVCLAQVTVIFSYSTAGRYLANLILKNRSDDGSANSRED